MRSYNLNATIPDLSLSDALHCTRGIDDCKVGLRSNRRLTRCTAAIARLSPDLCSGEALDQLMFSADLAPGRYVRLTVIDTGQGMDEQTLAHIFDPFFSTKFTGRGLGLAVQGIVRGHRGALSVSSAPRQGTVFSIWFPALDTPSTAMLTVDNGHEVHSQSHAM